MVVAVSGAVAIIVAVAVVLLLLSLVLLWLLLSCWAGAVVATDAVSVVMTGANTVGDAVIVAVAIAVAVAGLV